MDLGLDVAERNGYAVLSVRGEVDVYTAPKFRERLIELVSEGKHRIVVDLEGVDFLDSTGLGVLVGAYTAVRNAGGRLAIVNDHAAVLKVFTITALHEVLGVHPTLSQALAAVNDRQPATEP